MAVIWTESDGNRLQLERFAGFCTKLLAFTPLAICLPFFSPTLQQQYSQGGSQCKTGDEAQRSRDHAGAAQLAELWASRASEKQKNRSLCRGSREDER